MAKFTDRQLKELYANLQRHYNDCVTRHGNDGPEIYKEMYTHLQYAIESPLGYYSALDRAEKNKIYVAFNTIFYALYGKSNDIEAFQRPVMPVYVSVPAVVYKPIYVYRYNEPSVLDWILICSIMDNHNHAHVHYHGSSCWPDTDDKDLMATIILIVLAAIAAALAAAALYIMLQEFLNSAERFYYNEGMLKAAYMMATSLVMGGAFTGLSLAFAAGPLAELAIAAGLHPAGVVIAGTILLAIIGAGIGCYLSGYLYDESSKKSNQDAMDPEDPLRFRLTESEEEDLNTKGIDPIKVKCAMVALRAAIAQEQGNSKPVPSFLSRMFSNDKTQDLLQQVRQLRQGTLARVKVDGLIFDCRNVSPAVGDSAQAGNTNDDPPPYDPTR